MKCPKCGSKKYYDKFEGILILDNKNRIKGYEPLSAIGDVCYNCGYSSDELIADNEEV